jgi:AcrR family transcriptional regulator
LPIDHQRPPRAAGSYDAASVTAVAFGLFRARGYEATSVDQIARELGVTKAAIYHHLAGKEAILAAGINRAIQALTAVLEEEPALPGAGTPLQRFEHVLRRTLEVGLEHLDEVTVLLRLRGNTELEREMLDRRRGFDRAAAEIMREAVDAGDLPADTDALLMTRLIMGMNNWLTEWYQPNGPLSAAAVIDTVTRFAMAGLTAPTTPDR